MAYHISHIPFQCIPSSWKSFHTAASVLHWLKLRAISLLSPEVFPTKYEVGNKQNRFGTLLGRLITEVSSSGPGHLGF